MGDGGSSNGSANGAAAVYGDSDSGKPRLVAVGGNGTFSAGAPVGLVHGFRLEGERIQELVDVWTIESMMGIRTRYFLDFEMLMGVQPDFESGDDVTELVGAEKWMNISEGRREKLTRARAALRRAGDRVGSVLFWRYGMRDGETWPTFHTDVAALVPYTSTVEHRRLEMAHDLAEERIARCRRVAEDGEQKWQETRAHIVRSLELWTVQVAVIPCQPPGCMHCRLSDMIRVGKEAIARGDKTPSRTTKAARSSADQAIRRGADAEITRSVALRRAIAEPRAKGEALTEAREVREAFIKRATREANDMLEDASKKYDQAWFRLRRR